MLDSRRRPVGRLFYWAAIGIAALGLRVAAFGVPVPPQGGLRQLPSLTLSTWQMELRLRGT